MYVANSFGSISHFYRGGAEESDREVERHIDDHFKGVGKVTVLALLAALPALGQLPRRVDQNRCRIPASTPRDDPPAAMPAGPSEMTKRDAPSLDTRAAVV
jgi:hypothetical protein